MTLAIILNFLRKHWQWIVVGLVLVGLFSLYGSWRYRGSRIDALEVELSAAHDTNSRLLDTTARLQQAAKEWRDVAAECSDNTAKLGLEAEQYKQRLDQERRARAAERDARRQAEARLADAITASECEEAVKQLAEALR